MAYGDLSASRFQLVYYVMYQSSLGTVHFLGGRGGAGGIWGGSPKKKRPYRGGGHLKKIREKGWSSQIYYYCFKMGYVLLFLKNVFRQKQGFFLLTL